MLDLCEQYNSSGCEAYKIQLISQTKEPAVKKERWGMGYLIAETANEY